MRGPGAVPALLVLAAAASSALAGGEASARGVPPAPVDVEIVAPPGPAGAPPVFPEPRLREALAPYASPACDAAAAADALARRYRFLGYVPVIEAACEEGRLRVRLRESSHIVDWITFEPEDLSRLGIRPDPDFEEKRRMYPVPPDAPRAVLRPLLLTRAGDLYNFERYRSDSEALARLGYTVAFIPGPPPPDGSYPRGAYLIQSLTPLAPGASSGRRTNYIGGTASYGPRQGGAAGLLYEKDRLFGGLDRLSVAPAYNAGAGGSLSYEAPLLATRREPHRLYDLRARLYSDFRHDRQLDGVETDERQSGFTAAFGWRPLRLAAPHSVRFEIGVRHERVALEDVPPGESEGSTDAAQLGMVYEWRHTYRRPSLTARLAPSIDLALRARGGERTFVRPGLDATLHGRLPSGLESDLHFVGGTLDRRVPSFEQWSLGGPGTVRGFREDSFLGRHLAALQAEIWIPFVRPGGYGPPPPSPEGSETALAPFEPRAARLVKWALFADGGYLSGSTTGRNEAIAGAGVGIRFLVPHHPFVVKLDYGWGLGAKGGDAFPYVSLAYRF